MKRLTNQVSLTGSICAEALHIKPVFLSLATVLLLAARSQCADYVAIDLGTLGGSSSQATAVNNAGHIVGSSGTESGGFTPHAFLWTPANGMVGRISPGATVNNAAESVVGSGIARGAVSAHAFLWTAANGMQDLGTLGGDFCPALAINNAGWVVGEAHVGPDFPFRRAFL